MSDRGGTRHASAPPDVRPRLHRRRFALVLPDTVLDTAVAAAKRRLHPGFVARLDMILGHTPGGQRVRLLRWHRASPSDAAEAILVPWAFGEDCRPIAWSGPLGWIPQGTSGAVTGWLRPREGWIGGLPTFDVEMAHREPVWAENEPRWPDAGPGGRRMTPGEFLQLYAALPGTELLEREPGMAADRLRRWEREHPELAGLAPGPTILSHVYRYAGERAAKR